MFGGNHDRDADPRYKGGGRKILAARNPTWNSSLNELQQAYCTHNNLLDNRGYPTTNRLPATRYAQRCSMSKTGEKINQSWERGEEGPVL